MPVLADVRGLLVDLDGVVVTGRQPIPGAGAFLARTRRQGLPFLLLTNNSTAAPGDVAQRLRNVGIDVRPTEVLTSAQAAVGYLAAHRDGRSRVLVVGEDGLRGEAREQGFVLTDDGPADWVLAGLDRAFDYAKLSAATRAIRGGARFVGTNADALLPIEGGQVLPGAGSILAAIRVATNVEPVVVGKPEPGLFEHGLRRLGGLPPGQVAMIGDRFDTDVVGGRRAGLRTVLVLSGVTRAEDLAVAPFQPDAVAPDLAAVANLLGWPA